MLALGAIHVDIPESDVFTGLERGTIDGLLGGMGTNVAMETYVEAPYFIDHPFYKASQQVLIFNQDRWNSLPKDLQNLMLDILLEMEPEILDHFKSRRADLRAKIVAGGGIPITFSPEDAKWYIDLAYSSIWDELKKSVSSESYNKLQQFLRQ